MDISNGGELGVSGSNHGLLKIWQTSDGTELRDLKGHISDVFLCKFFPSGEVVLSGGSDLQLKIWSALDGDCAAILKGHTGGILDSDFIERGRNIVSVSTDGTARLWECGSQSIISILSKSDRPFNSCFVCQTTPKSSSRPIDSREYGTDGKLVLLAGDAGIFEGIDLRSQEKAFMKQLSIPLNSIIALNSKFFVIGDDQGAISIWDVANLNKPLSISKKTDSPIKKLIPDSNDSFWMSTGDGLCLLINLKNEIKENLTGSNYDPILAIQGHKNILFTAGRDSIIRKYLVC